MTDNPVPFIQYMRPAGFPKSVEHNADDPEVARKGREIWEAGYRLECEVLTTGQCAFSVTDPDEGDLEIEVCGNGPVVVERIANMINRFHAKLESGEVPRRGDK